MGDIIIRITVPDGVTPEVEYAAAPKRKNHEDPEPDNGPPGDEPPPWSGWETNAAPGGSSAPTGKPECPQHHKGRQRANGAWFCPTPIEKDGNDNVVKWCPWKP